MSLLMMSRESVIYFRLVISEVEFDRSDPPRVKRSAAFEAFERGLSSRPQRLLYCGDGHNGRAGERK